MLNLEWKLNRVQNGTMKNGDETAAAAENHYTQPIFFAFFVKLVSSENIQMIQNCLI